MSPELLIALFAVFATVALAIGAATSAALGRMTPEQRRLRKIGIASASGVVIEGPLLGDDLSPLARRLARLAPKSPKDMSLLRRRLTTAGYGSMESVIIFSAVRIALPIGCVLLALSAFGFRSVGLLAAAAAALLGFMAPEVWISRATRLRQQLIRNGLPDALDLLIICLEAGSSVDQAFVKTSEELEVAHPVLAEELHLVTTEIRAGKPRIEALKNLADRTRVDDVRALVTMLTQTERFGTSLSQALRTHAETSRTKRRQRAEERAQKVGVKMVFPLVFFLFPALYIVILGSAFVKFVNFFATHGRPSIP
jgi:tight adherence protein C